MRYTMSVRHQGHAATLASRRGCSCDIALEPRSAALKSQLLYLLRGGEGKNGGTYAFALLGVCTRKPASTGGAACRIELVEPT